MGGGRRRRRRRGIVTESQDNLEAATQSMLAAEIEIDETSMQFIDASSRMPTVMESPLPPARYLAHSQTALPLPLGQQQNVLTQCDALNQRGNEN